MTRMVRKNREHESFAQKILRVVDTTDKTLSEARAWIRMLVQKQAPNIHDLDGVYRERDRINARIYQLKSKPNNTSFMLRATNEFLLMELTLMEIMSWSEHAEGC